MGQTPSIPSEAARLTFSNNSLRNNKLNCDAHGIQYKLSTSRKGIKLNHITTFSRWDPQTRRNVEIADYERRAFGKDKIRFRPGFGGRMNGPAGLVNDGFVRLDRFLDRTKGSSGRVRVNRTFKVNGNVYTWKSRKGSLTLYCKQNRRVPIASFSKRKYIFGSHMPCIKLAPGCEEILDYIVVSCIISERKRREARKRQRASEAGNTTSGVGGVGGVGGGVGGVGC